MASETIIITKPEPPALVEMMAPLVAQARAFEVTDIESDRHAQERGASLRRAEKMGMEYFEPARKAADEAKKKIIAARDGIVGPWAEARAIYFSKSDTYQADERRKALEQERVLQERARKEEEERQIQAAIDAESRGESAESAAIMNEPTAAPVVTVAPAVAKVEGVSTMTRWEPEIVDVRACLRFLCDRPEWEAALDRLKPELVTILRPLAVAQRQALAIPGVRAVSKTVRATR